MWVNLTQHKPIYKGANGPSQGAGEGTTKSRTRQAGEGTMKSRTRQAGEPTGGGFIAVS